MSADSFKECASHHLGQTVQDWDDAVIKPLGEVAEWYRNQSGPVKYIFDKISDYGGKRLVTFLTVLVGASEAAVVAAVIASFAAGVGVGTALTTIIECGDELV
jgi:hypothetical protein